MKISNKKLKRIIKEELQKILKEQEAVGLGAEATPTGAEGLPPMPDPKILLKFMCANKDIVINSLEKSGSVENLKKILLNSIPGAKTMVDPLIKMIEDTTKMNIDQVLKTMRSTGPFGAMAKMGITMTINTLCSGAK